MSRFYPSEGGDPFARVGFDRAGRLKPVQIAVLPLNAGPESRATLARQLSHFASELARGITGNEIHAVNLMAQYQDGGVTRFAQANPSETLNETELISQFFANSPMEAIVDGLLVESSEGGGTLSVRSWEKGSSEPVGSNEFTYLPGGFFSAARGMVEFLAKVSGGSIPQEGTDDVTLFGTEDPAAFVEFLVGFDAVQYVERSQGAVASEFDPMPALASLMSAYEKDPDWEAPYMGAVRLCRVCIQHRLGDANVVRENLHKLAESEPDDPRAPFALGELASVVGDLNQAVDQFEKSATALSKRIQSQEQELGSLSGAERAEAEDALRAMRADQSPILARLGMTQAQMGMPANAERNLAKAIEVEPEPKPSTELLATLLESSGRAHEVPPLWKARVDANPGAGGVHARYALSLVAAGKDAEGLREFDLALERAEDPLEVKRAYASVLARKGEFDRAMDMFEDCIDANPADPNLLLEYANTLQGAERQFEVPKVLRDVLACNIDPNTRAQTQAWLLEIEQPKRVEAVKNAADKAQAGDAQAAVTELRGLKNWLADYWKFWAVFANALNQVGAHDEAEDAGVRLLNMFPNCEPAFGELATALSGQDRHEEAYNLLRNAMSTMPGSLPVAVNFALAAKRTGRLEEAQNIGRQIKQATEDAEGLRAVFQELGV